MPLVSNQDVVVTEKKTEITLVQVLNVPDFVERYLDIDARLCLRKTCTTIRNIINEKSLHIGCLKFNCYGMTTYEDDSVEISNENCVEISTDEGFKVTYKSIEELGLEVTNGDRRKFIHEQKKNEQIKIIQKDLMSILCGEKLRIDTLRIENDHKTDEDDDDYYGISHHCYEDDEDEEDKDKDEKDEDEEDKDDENEEDEDEEDKDEDDEDKEDKNKDKEDKEKEAKEEVDNEEEGWDHSTQIGMRALQKTFKQIPNKLKVNNLEYFVQELDNVFIETLEKIDPEHLKSLQLRIYRYYICAVDWAYLYNLEQWKRLKSIDVCYSLSAIPDIANSFTHFENAYLEIADFFLLHGGISKPDLVMQIKEKLLENPNLKQFILCASDDMSDSDFDDINASLQQYNTNNAPHPCWVTIPYPDSDKKLELLVKKKTIWFKGPCYVEGEGEEEREDDDEEEEDSDEDDDYEEEFNFNWDNEQFQQLLNF